MAQNVEKQCAAAVETLIRWQGTIAELARVACVSRVAAFKWRNNNGRVGEGAAVLLGNLPGSPLTPQQIRPDLDAGFVKAYETPETRAAIRAQTVYLKKRDADALRIAAKQTREVNSGTPQRKTRHAKRVKG